MGPINPGDPAHVGCPPHRGPPAREGPCVHRGFHAPEDPPPAPWRPYKPGNGDRLPGLCWPQHLWGHDSKGCWAAHAGGAVHPLPRLQLPTTKHNPLVRNSADSQNPCGQLKRKQSRDEPPHSPALWDHHPSQQPLRGCGEVCRRRRAPEPLCDARSQAPPSPHALLALAAASWARGGWKHPGERRIRVPWHKVPWHTSWQLGEGCGFQPRQGAEPR